LQWFSSFSLPGVFPMSLSKSSLGSLCLLFGCLVASGVAQESEIREVTQGSRAQGSPASWLEVVSNPVTLLLLMAMVFYLLLIVPSYRSSKKMQKDLDQKLANLKKNDRVVTSFGVHGVVAGIHSETKTVTLRIDENTNAKMTVNRETIRVVNKD
jgi:preprotein translocase subunit YajC